jgi:molybdate transport system ATP-binding protein
MCTTRLGLALVAWISTSRFLQTVTELTPSSSETQPASGVPMIEDANLDPRKFAAVVYDDGVAVDLLLATFVDQLRSRSVRVGGIVQMPPTEPGCGPGALRSVRDLATGETLSICRVDGAEGCRFDPEKLQEASQRVQAASEGCADIVFVSRFGKEEARGGGLCGELARAAGAGRPVLTAVRRGLVPNWLSFSGGIGTMLEARLWVLENWWDNLAMSSQPKARGAL